MSQWHLAKIAGLMLMLSGCAGPARPVVQNIYPNLPDVPPLPPLLLQPVQIELPSKTSFVGLDYSNWASLQINLQTLKQRLLQYQQRIAQVNAQRADWRKSN